MGNAKLKPTFFLPDKLIVQEDFVTITHNVNENWLYIHWQGERTQQMLLQGAEKVLQAVVATGSTKIINDSSDYQNPWPKNLIDMFAEQFAPRLQEAGIQHFAWIYDDQNVTKSAADAILKKEKSDILVMVFDNVKNAETWLRAVR